MSDEVSRLRQRLQALRDQTGALVKRLLAERPGLIRGTFGTRARQCGKAGCRCTRGELHESKYLAAAVGGRTRQVHVPAGDEVRVAQGVKRYQDWRRTRGEIAQRDTELLMLIDALGLALLAAYPPDDPVPPPEKRGRKPKKSSGCTP